MSKLVKLSCRVNPDTHKIEARLFYLQDTLEGDTTDDIVHQLNKKHSNLNWQNLTDAMRAGHSRGWKDDTLAWECEAEFHQSKPEGNTQ